MKHIFIVAEIGCNHNGSKQLAREMIIKAKECGVDAVKFQTFKAEDLISCYAPKAEYQKITTGIEESQLEMTKKLELSQENFIELKAFAENIGLIAFSTPFDFGSIDFLSSLGQKLWKIPSGEITNLPFLRKVAKVCPKDGIIILSTGMSSINEIRDCIEVLINNEVSSAQIVILHCNTEYPTPDCDVNISAIFDLHKNFPGFKIGFSDHSVGYVAAVGAAMLEVCLIEKHFTLDKFMEGPDHIASATPAEMKQLCENVRRIELMKGTGKKKVTESEKKNRAIARESIVAISNIKKGDVFSVKNIACKRPGNGISPMEWDRILGLRSESDFLPDELIKMNGFRMQGD